MAKSADIGSKRLISLAPEAWVRWLVGDERVEFVDMLSADFQWVNRETDVLMRARQPDLGEFLILNEIQLRYNDKLPRRIQAYAALAEERFERPVYPVLVNILNPGLGQTIPTQYHAEFLGLVARRDYRVINLWEVDAGQVLAEQLTPLFPFVPVMRGGAEERVLRQALEGLRAAPDLADLEPLLAFFARFVRDSEFIRRLMRWDMTILRQSPWYEEILEEGREIGRQEGVQEGREIGRQVGLQEGRQEGQQEGMRLAMEESIMRVLRHRFGPPPDDIHPALRQLPLSTLEGLIDLALDAASWDDFKSRLPKASGS